MADTTETKQFTSVLESEYLNNTDTTTKETDSFSASVSQVNTASTDSITSIDTSDVLSDTTLDDILGFDTSIGDLSIDVDTLTKDAAIDTDNLIVTGSGAFDKMMETATKHLEVQFEANRIKGEDYATAYVDIYKTTLASVIQLMTSKAQAAQALAQVQLIKAQTIKAYVEAKYAVPKIKAEIALLKAQTESQKNQSQTYLAQINKLAEDTKLVSRQQDLVAAQTLAAQKQAALLQEQAETETPKRNLYKRQIEGYDEEFKYKMIKAGYDSWAVAFSVAKDTMTSTEDSGGGGIPVGITKAALDAIYNNYILNQWTSTSDHSAMSKDNEFKNSEYR